MKRIAFVLVVLALAAPMPALAQASGWSRATAALQVGGTVTVSATWAASGSSHVDFGTMLPNHNTGGVINLQVNHNLPTAQTFGVQAMVDKNSSSSSWLSPVTVEDPGVQTLSWVQSAFGTTQAFTTPIGGSGTSFIKGYMARFEVVNNQTPGDYLFWIDFTVTQL